MKTNLEYVAMGIVGVLAGFLLGTIIIQENHIRHNPEGTIIDGRIFYKDIGTSCSATPEVIK